MIKSAHIKKTNSPKTYQWILVLLVIVMALRIVSYFTLFPESVGLTRGLKTGMRFFLTGFSILFWFRLRIQHPTITFSYDNRLSGIFYGFYVLLSVASVLWSTDVMFTLLQLAMLFESIVFVWVFYHLMIFGESLTEGRASFAKIMGISVAIISFIFILGQEFDPETYYRGTHGGAVSRLGGFIINPNELGMLSVIGATMAYVRFWQGGGKFWNITFWGLNVSVLLMTQSRSSLAAFLLVSLVFVLMSKNTWLRLGTLVVGIFAIPYLIQKIIIKEGNIDEVLSMTGRLPFWSDLLTYGFPERPILGYGFMSISSSPYTNKFDSIHAYAASMTHNTFVQVLINLGLVGAFIVIIQMFLTFRAVVVSHNSKLKITAFAMLIPILINSFTEFGIFGEANYGIYFYHLIILMFIVSKSEKKFQVRPGIYTQKKKEMEAAISGF